MNSISIILDILNNLFYESLLSVQGNIIERIKLNKFKKKVDLTARKIINNNDGSILTSNTFELFLKNYHPIEKMFLTISGDGDYEFKEQFITKQIELFFNSCNSKIEKPLDRYAFKELFENLSARDREILGRKYGAFGYEETSVNDIADYMLITRNAVNKAVNSATEILRKEYHNGSKLIWWRLCNRAVKDALEGRTA